MSRELFGSVARGSVSFCLVMNRSFVAKWPAFPVFDEFWIVRWDVPIPISISKDSLRKTCFFGVKDGE